MVDGLIAGKGEQSRGEKICYTTINRRGCCMVSCVTKYGEACHLNNSHVLMYITHTEGRMLNSL